MRHERDQGIKFTIKLQPDLLQEINEVANRYGETTAAEVRRGCRILIQLERLRRDGNEVFIRETDHGNQVFYRTPEGIEKGLIFI